MKKVFTLFVFLLGMSFLGFSQEKESFKSIISEKWNIDFIEIDNEIMNVSNEGHWMVFLSNGVYKIMLDKKEQLGTWSFDENNKINFDAENFEGEAYLKKINENELKFTISGYTLALSK